MVNKSIVAGISFLLFACFVFGQKKSTISGKVSEKGSGESLIGVNIYIPTMKTGTVSNNFGFYSITIASDTAFTIVFSYIGYAPQSFRINPGSVVTQNIELVSSLTLNTIEVKAERDEKISDKAEMSKVEIPIAQIKNIPALLGEKDVLKTLQLMPGVQKGTEGTAGIYVRGGGPDQNLIILDDATVYNANHLFGFFSLFNGDALKSVEMYKGGFPARYGGRLSSVIEMNMKDGNLEKYKGEVGIGLISSRFTFEGPVKKNKSSFLISGRRTYIDVLTKPMMNNNNGNAGYYFYDLTAKANYTLNDKNRIYLSGYFGRDKFYFKEKASSSSSTWEAGMFWENSTATARWNHIHNPKLFSNLSFIFSKYNLSIYNREYYNNSYFKLKYNSGIRDFSVKYDFLYAPHVAHTIRFGLQSTSHRFKPSAVVFEDTGSNEFERKINTINVIENGLYAEDEFHSGLWRANAGIRLSHYNIGNSNYLRPEPRLLLSYQLGENTSAKASYTRMNQYTHLISNTGIGLPTDLWVPSTKHIRPQQGDQIAAGLAHDWIKQNFSISFEGYYKKSYDILGYKEGASFLLIDDPTNASDFSWERNVTQGTGKSYGVEFLLQRKSGKLSGWVGYTLSWIKLQYDELNNGEPFFAKYDRRHDASVVAIYQLTKDITLSGTWVFSSGNAMTLPMESYDAVLNDYAYSGNSGYNIPLYVTSFGPKNSFRMKPYHRLDFGVQFHKKLKKGERTWEFSIYNAYNRKNPFFYYLNTETDGSGNTKNTLKQVSLFPLIPSISYNYKF